MNDCPIKGCEKSFCREHQDLVLWLGERMLREGIDNVYYPSKQELDNADWTPRKMRIRIQRYKDNE